MATAKVKNILDPEAQSGMGKNGKPWSMAQVELDNGKSIKIFNPIEVGDLVESYKNGEYWNWRKVKGGQTETSAPANTDALRELYKLNLAIYKAITGEDYTGVQKETTSAPKPVTEPVQTSEVPVEAYADISDEELNSVIPF